VAFAAAPSAPEATSLARLAYNNPGLLVDLGVGLWAWPLPLDYNGDGLMDLVVACTDTPSNGVYVFLNTGRIDPVTGLPVMGAATRIGAAGPSPQISYVDGKPMVTTAGRHHPDFLRSGLEKPVRLGDPAKIHPDKGQLRANQWKFVDFDGDGALDLVVGIDFWGDYGWDDAWDAQGKWKNGPLHGYVYLLRNRGTTAKPDYEAPRKVMTTVGQPVDVFGMPSPCFADFDGDGDLDVLCGEFLDGFTYYENIGTRSQPRYAPGRRLTVPPGADAQARPSAWKATREAATLPGSPRPLTMDLQMITPVALDWNQDGHLDLIVGDEDGRVAFLENTGKFTADHTPLFLPPRYFQQEATDLKFGALATPYGFDWDGDGDMDLLSGNTAGYIGWFENLSGPGVAKPKFAVPKLLMVDGQPLRIMAGENGSIQGPAEAKWGYTTFTVADWDGDGRPDLVVNSILGEVVWYRNIGTRQAPQLAPAQPIEVEWNGAQPALAWGWRKPAGKALLTQWRTTPVAVDWNHDGLVDLVMLDHEGYLCLFERTRREGRLVLLPPQRVCCDEAGQPLRLNARTAGQSGRRKLCVVDWDGDGKLDLLVNSSSADFYRQVRAADGKWHFRNEGPLVKQNIEGHDVSPTVVDFRGDGIPDFLGGAEDGRFYFLANPRHR
jgi:hypothetical protein